MACPPRSMQPCKQVTVQRVATLHAGWCTVKQGGQGQRPVPTLVAFRASSTRSFFSLSSVSVWAPTCTPTPFAQRGHASANKAQQGAAWAGCAALPNQCKHRRRCRRLCALRVTRQGQLREFQPLAAAGRPYKSCPYTSYATSRLMHAAHLDDGHAAAQARDALVQLLLLVLSLSLGGRNGGRFSGTQHIRLAGACWHGALLQNCSSALGTSPGQLPTRLQQRRPYLGHQVLDLLHARLHIGLGGAVAHNGDVLLRHRHLCKKGRRMNLGSQGGEPGCDEGGAPGETPW